MKTTKTLLKMAVLVAKPYTSFMISEILNDIVCIQKYLLDIKVLHQIILIDATMEEQTKMKPMLLNNKLADGILYVCVCVCAHE